jgi:hypothetical protein
LKRSQLFTAGLTRKSRHQASPLARAGCKGNLVESLLPSDSGQYCTPTRPTQRDCTARCDVARAKPPIGTTELAVPASSFYVAGSSSKPRSRARRSSLPWSRRGPGHQSPGSSAQSVAQVEASSRPSYSGARPRACRRSRLRRSGRSPREPLPVFHTSCCSLGRFILLSASSARLPLDYVPGWLY